MSKELFISSSPHETKVAVLEDDQLVEVYYERDTDVGLVGGIYKGRVSRVLPGMQSAFVDIGLERDAFLYVSDFFEDAEEYDKIVSEAEARVLRDTEGPPVSSATAPAAPPETLLAEPASRKPAETSGVLTGSSGPPEIAAPQPGVAPISPSALTPVSAPPPAATVPPGAPRPGGEGREYRRQSHRGRRRPRRGREFGEHKFSSGPPHRDRQAEHQTYGAPHPFEIMPGESLAKYSHLTPEAPASPTPAAPTEPGVEEPDLAKIAALEAPSTPIHHPVAEDSGSATSAASSVSSEPAPSEEKSVAVSKASPSSPWSDLPEPIPQPAQEQPATAAVESPDTFGATETTSAPSVPVSETGPAAAARPTSTEPAEGPLPEPVSSILSGLAAPEASFQIETSSVAMAEKSPGVADKEDGTSSLAPPPETASGPTQRTYTLREPHQRPRFAPRRGRRGRRGMGRAPRAEGTPTSRYEPPRPANHHAPQISELLKEGQEILVQIAKEPLGRKGARITSHIAMPGRYLVYMPTIDHIGVSRRIVSEEERLRLRNIILENRGSLTGGFIVRTAGEGRSEDEFKADLKFLSTLWNEIRGKAERMKAPALIHRDLDLVQRILRDILSPDFKSIRVDSEIEYERVLDFVSRSQPALMGQVKLYTRDTPMFEEVGIDAEIEKALKPKVWLKSGGYIVINQTEALVAIDVNTGKYVGKTNRLEDTIVKTNIDAVNEIVRQIRLRDLGGIIVIDFIDMDDRRNRNKVAQALDEALRRDRAPTKIVSFNDFGLVAITRKRVKQSLERTLCEPCQYCSGSGWIKSVTSICYEILAEARKMVSQIEGNVINLRVNPEVAHALKSREGRLISELESITRKDVIIRSDTSVHQERYEIY